MTTYQIVTTINNKTEAVFNRLSQAKYDMVKMFKPATVKILVENKGIYTQEYTYSFDKDHRPKFKRKKL